MGTRRSIGVKVRLIDATGGGRSTQCECRGLAPSRRIASVPYLAPQSQAISSVGKHRRRPRSRRLLVDSSAVVLRNANFRLDLYRSDGWLSGSDGNEVGIGSCSLTGISDGCESPNTAATPTRSASLTLRRAFSEQSTFDLPPEQTQTLQEIAKVVLAATKTRRAPIWFPARARTPLCTPPPDVRGTPIPGAPWRALRFDPLNARPDPSLPEAIRDVPIYSDEVISSYSRLADNSYRTILDCGVREIISVARDRPMNLPREVDPAPLIRPLAIPIGDIVRQLTADAGCQRLLVPGAARDPFPFCPAPDLVSHQVRDGEPPRYDVRWRRGDVLDITFTATLRRQPVNMGLTPLPVPDGLPPPYNVDGFLVGIGGVQRGDGFRTCLLGDNVGAPVAVLGAGAAPPPLGAPDRFGVRGEPLTHGGHLNFVGNGIAAPFISFGGLDPVLGQVDAPPKGWVPPQPRLERLRLPLLTELGVEGDQNRALSGRYLTEVSPIQCRSVRVFVTLAMIDLGQQVLPMEQRGQNCVGLWANRLAPNLSALVMTCCFQWTFEANGRRYVMNYPVDLPRSRWPSAFGGAFRAPVSRFGYHDQVSKMAVICTPDDRLPPDHRLGELEPPHAKGLIIGAFSNLNACGRAALALDVGNFEARLRFDAEIGAGGVLPVVLPLGAIRVD